jgi:hypothetical protein
MIVLKRKNNKTFGVNGRVRDATVNVRLAWKASDPLPVIEEGEKFFPQFGKDLKTPSGHSIQECPPWGEGWWITTLRISPHEVGRIRALALKIRQLTGEKVFLSTEEIFYHNPSKWVVESETGTAI